MRNITTIRDDAEELDRKRRAAELVDILTDCIRRHTQLQARLQEAGATFRAEQDRQQFSGPPRRATVDLFGQLLIPCLDLPLADAARPTGVFFGAGIGLWLPSVPGLVGLVEMLLVPVSDRDRLGADLAEPDLAPMPDPDRFSEAQWRAADTLFDLDEVPRRLSGLLASARAVDPDLAGLVVLRALHAFGLEIGTAIRQGERQVLIAIDDGTRLADPEFGGADLLVAAARVKAPDESTKEGVVA